MRTVARVPCGSDYYLCFTVHDSRATRETRFVAKMKIINNVAAANASFVSLRERLTDERPHDTSNISDRRMRGRKQRHVIRPARRVIQYPAAARSLQVQACRQQAGGSASSLPAETFAPAGKPTALLDADFA